ncbi:MAG: hypothetical protein AAFO97_10335 [Pseudomonadota bacterium]
MKRQTSTALASVERACFRVVALVKSRLSGRDTRAEMQRLNTQKRLRSYGETCVVLGILFGLALLATSLGVWALCLLFLCIFLVFR